MKKLSIALACLFAIFANKQLQAIDFTKIVVSALALGSSKNQPIITQRENTVDKDLNQAAQQQLRNMKPYNVGFNNLYNAQNKQDDTQKNNGYYLRGSYKPLLIDNELFDCDQDDCPHKNND